VFGHHAHRRQVQRQRAVEVVLEGEAHLTRAFDQYVLHVGVLLAITQAALGHQQIEGVAHVFGGDWLAVGEACLGVQRKAHP
jgi:hypothetical protein